ncbi:MAG: energy transducer TonB [Acidobacteria bacterium]|nr:energy transducer TonB [Acidobacteriota bacterium]
MFETAVLTSGAQTKRVWTTFLGFSGQALLLSCLALAPLISPQVLPRVAWAIALAPPAPPPPPPPVNLRVVPTNTVRATHVFNGIAEPTTVPERVIQVIDPPDAAPAGAYVPGAITGGPIGAANNLMRDILTLAGRATPNFRPPEPPVREPQRPAAVQQAAAPRITVLQMAEPIQRVPPVYPQLARAARIAGRVELMGVLGTDGRIHEVRVLSGHPLLVKAAVDAVMQWVYRPTILNGVAVEVQAPITVNFILN